MEISELKKQQSDKLLFLGVLLFFLGLIAGLLVPAMPNPRMGLSGHLEGIMNGIFLMVVALIWTRLELSSGWLRITFWASIYGTFTNLVAVLLAAIFNSGKMMPIAGGQQGPPVIEGIVSFLLISLAVAMLAVCIILMTGILNHINSKS
jgi:(hydroxyamino)benzene mutase